MADLKNLNIEFDSKYSKYYDIISKEKNVSLEIAKHMFIAHVKYNNMDLSDLEDSPKFTDSEGIDYEDAKLQLSNIDNLSIGIEADGM